MRRLIKLYKVPNDSLIDVSHLGLETFEGVKVTELDFKHIDGMYSLCYFNNQIIHLSASTGVYLKEEV